MKHLQLTDELEGQASLYAAGALPEDESTEFARHLQEDQCLVCRAAVDEFQSVTSLLAYAVPAAAPSDSLKTRLMKQARDSAPARRQSSFFQHRWLGLATGMAAVAATVVMLLAIQSNRELRHLTDELNSRIARLEVELSQQRTYIAALTSPGNRVIELAGQGANVGARGRIFWDQPRQRWFVYVSNLPRVADNLSYQLWFVPKNGNPVSASVFNTQANGSQEIQVDLPLGLTDLKAAAVTTEPAGGLLQPSGAFALLGASD